MSESSEKPAETFNPADVYGEIQKMYLNMSEEERMKKMRDIQLKDPTKVKLPNGMTVQEFRETLFEQHKLEGEKELKLNTAISRKISSANEKPVSPVEKHLVKKEEKKQTENNNPNTPVPTEIIKNKEDNSKEVSIKETPISD